MSQEMYSVALKSALTEIKNICPDINWSFILMNDGLVIAGDGQAMEPAIEEFAGSFQTLAEKASAIGGLDNILIDAERGKVYVSCINDMYLIAGLKKHADLPYFRNITQVIFPTIIKVLDKLNSPSIAPTLPKPAPSAPSILSKTISYAQTDEAEEIKPKKLEQTEQQEPLEISEPLEAEAEEEEPQKKPSTLPSQQLIVDRFGGLLMRSDSVQIDEEILKRWSELLGVEEINEVEIETFNGKTAHFKTKVITDPKLQGRGLIRIPEKSCQALEIKRGELIRVKPVVPEE
jgi:predicted regulator of Ras-like GTPase activity (Roadblock/LC7/MglB family)